MKIKIPPYPNFKITNEAFKRDVELNSVKKNNSKGLSNQLLFVIEFKTGEKKVVKSRPVRHKDKLNITAFPNPVHLFLSLAIDHFTFSEQIKETNFPKCGKKYGEDIYLLDIEANGTHDCYNDYIKYRASSIIMLVSAIEAYLNHIIPNDFVYKTKRNNREIAFSKTDIESPKITFREKLTETVPKSINNDNFWENSQEIKSTILDLYENRKNLIHLKTNSQSDFDIYFETIDKMLDLDINSAIESTILFMNKAKPNFIDFEKEDE
jgi:hypothetical protein